MDEKMKTVLERTKATLCRHLEDINDAVDANGGRVEDHMTIDGIKDSLKGLAYIKELMQVNGTAATAAKLP